MAKGIIVKRPSSGDPNGRIIVTDPIGDASGRDATMVSEVGAVLTYSEVNQSALGDIVDFAYDGKEASHLATAIKGTVITGSYKDNVVVAAGQSVVINAGNLEGKISVNGGFLAVVGSSFLAGKIESATAGSFILVDDQSTIEGKLDISNTSTLSVKNSTVEGKISSNGNVYASVMNCTIRGKLEVLNAKVCRCSNNTVIGETNTPGCTA